jgi:hypothetical protein
VIDPISESRSGGWLHTRFRKIDDETTEEFRQQMRSLGKQTERVS